LVVVGIALLIPGIVRLPWNAVEGGGAVWLSEDVVVGLTAANPALVCLNHSLAVHHGQRCGLLIDGKAQMRGLRNRKGFSGGGKDTEIVMTMHPRIDIDLA
jgi:hypothetical protein